MHNGWQSSSVNKPRKKRKISIFSTVFCCNNNCWIQVFLLAPSNLSPSLWYEVYIELIKFSHSFLVQNFHHPSCHYVATTCIINLFYFISLSSDIKTFCYNFVCFIYLRVKARSPHTGCLVKRSWQIQQSQEWQQLQCWHPTMWLLYQRLP